MSRGQRRHRPDVGIILLVGVLLAFGLVVIYSISPILSQELMQDAGRNYFFYNQLLHIIIGLILFVVASQFPLKWWRKVLPWMAGLTATMLIVMLIPQVGISEGGATRWLGLGPFSFQPAELVKFVAVIGTAAWFASLSKNEIKDYRFTLLPVIIALAILALFVVFHQRDLGTMLVVALIIGSIFFVSGVKWRHLAALLAAGGVAGVLSIIMFPHRMERISTFFSPSEGLAESSYHLHQALIAVGSGGIFGLGLGGSVQVYGYLPEAANDSIFAIIAETFGLVGALSLVVLFAMLIYRCLLVASRSDNIFARYIVVGIAIWIGAQAMMNVMAMIGIIPLTGITLPFLSYGGTSMVMVLLAMGVVTHISKYTVRIPNENSRQRRGERRSHNAHTGRRTSSQAA